MSDFSALHGLRIGCVQYLNSRPLIQAYDGPVTLEHPSALAADLAAGLLDAALVPTYEVLRDPRYMLVDGVAIASDGPVYSVVLIYRGPLAQIKSVKLDPASRTSQNLTRILLAEYHGIEPEYGNEGEAELLIGNQAIDFRDRNEGADDMQILDLGAEWKRCTGLPFVYAMWAVRADVPHLPAVADAFRALKTQGMAELETIIADDTISTPEFRRRYLAEHIRFDLGNRERLGIAKYRELLAKYGRIEDAATPLKFI